jgi:hypothetical protein
MSGTLCLSLDCDETILSLDSFLAQLKCDIFNRANVDNFQSYLSDVVQRSRLNAANGQCLPHSAN